MRQIKHPFSLAIYELDEDYNVLVTKGDLSGVFDPEGRYIHGVIRSCDPELARWVGLGPRERGDISQNRRYMDATETIQLKLASMAKMAKDNHTGERDTQ